MKIFVHENDLPDSLDFPGDVAIDTEAMGLNIARDRLCLVQISFGDGIVHLVKPRYNNCPNLKRLLLDESIVKIFHYARFDIAILKQYLGIWTKPFYCTKIASKLSRTYASSHSLRELCSEIAGVRLNKQQQCSDWGREHLTQDQKNYAASDVLYLHQIRNSLDYMLNRCGREELARGCFEALYVIMELDLLGWEGSSLFNHMS